MFSVEQLAKSERDCIILKDYYKELNPDSNILENVRHCFRSFEPNKCDNPWTNPKHFMAYGTNCVYVIINNHLIHFGFSSCKDQNEYSKKVGYNMALMRLLYYPLTLTKKNFFTAHQAYFDDEGEIRPLPILKMNIIKEVFTFYDCVPSTLGSIIGNIFCGYIDYLAVDFWNIPAEKYYGIANQAIEKAWYDMAMANWNNRRNAAMQESN